MRRRGGGSEVALVIVVFYLCILGLTRRGCLDYAGNILAILRLSFSTSSAVLFAHIKFHSPVTREP